MAHRGASGNYPENTLAAYRAARAIGADGIELDARLSADGIPVVMHDASVDRTTDGRGAVSDFPLSELKRLDAGAWKHPRFAGERVPTVDEVFAAIPDGLVFVELKTNATVSNGLEEAVLSVVERHGAADRVIYCSFNPTSLARMAALGATSRIAPIVHPKTTNDEKRAWKRLLAHADALHAEKSQCTARTMRWARERGYMVNPWTIDDPAEMRRLIALRVDAIVTNFPEVLAPILREAAA
jgi:glycerophosphoryl diester phosphodiesterase